MKISAADLTRYGQPLADEFCRRLYDQNGDRVDSIAIILHLDTVRRFAKACAAAMPLWSIPAVPNALPFFAPAHPVGIAFAPSFDEEGTDASFFENPAVTSTFPFLRKRHGGSVEEMIRLETLDVLASWSFRCFGFPKLVGLQTEAGRAEVFSPEDAREARGADSLARKWAAEGLPERVYPWKAKPKPTGLLRRPGRLCICRHQSLFADAHPEEHDTRCTSIAVRLRETAAIDPTEVRSRVAPLVAVWLESTWPRYHVQRGEAWAAWREHLVLDGELLEAEKQITEAQQAHAAALVRLQASGVACNLAGSAT